MNSDDYDKCAPVEEWSNWAKLIALFELFSVTGDDKLWASIVLHPAFSERLSIVEEKRPWELKVRFVQEKHSGRFYCCRLSEYESE